MTATGGIFIDGLRGDVMRSADDFHALAETVVSLDTRVVRIETNTGRATTPRIQGH